MKFSKRSEKLTSSPLYAFFRKVKEAEAAGRKIISLGMGEPYQDTSEEIKQAGIEAIRANKTHYNPPAGSLELRKMIAEKYKVDTANVSVSSGAKPFLAFVFLSLLDEGDAVLLTGPTYPPFVQIVESCGGQAEIIDTKSANFQLTFETVKNSVERIEKNYKNLYLLVNSPNNPTGVVYDQVELEKIVYWCKEKGITIISDECYSNFSPEPEFTLRQFSDEIIVINSFSKTYAMTGWRVGYVVCPLELNSVIGKFLDCYMSCPSSISDAAAITAIKTKPLADFVLQREIIHAWLEKNDIDFVKSTGGIFIFPDFSKVMQKKNIATSIDLASYFLNEANVATTPGAAFGEAFDTHLRITYCIDPEELKTALLKLEEVIK